MSATEFRSWQAYAQIEPFGHHYDDLRQGAIVAAIYNVNADPKKRREAFQPLDFAPWNALSKRLHEPKQLPNAAAEEAALLQAFGVPAAQPDLQDTLT